MYKPFEINRSEDGQFYATVVAENGEIIYTSETLKRKQSVVTSIISLASVVIKSLNWELPPNTSADLKKSIKDNTRKPINKLQQPL